jgi:acyl dehydratase
VVSQDFVGRTYPPEGVYEVGREKIREFAEAMAGSGGPRAVHPAHLDPAAARALGHADVVAPPTFAVILAQRSDARFVLDPAAGIDYSRVVHGEQRFTHHRPIRAGDRLVSTTTIDAVRSVGGNDLLTTRVDVATEDGEAVCTATSMLVARGTA